MEIKWELLQGLEFRIVSRERRSVSLCSNIFKYCLSCQCHALPTHHQHVEKEDPTTKWSLADRFSVFLKLQKNCHPSPARWSPAHPMQEPFNRCRSPWFCRHLASYSQYLDGFLGDALGSETSIPPQHQRNCSWRGRKRREAPL